MWEWTAQFLDPLGRRGQLVVMGLLAIRVRRVCRGFRGFRVFRVYWVTPDQRDVRVRREFPESKAQQVILDHKVMQEWTAQ
jgi:hypothetical protein